MGRGLGCGRDPVERSQAKCGRSRGGAEGGASARGQTESA